MQDLFSLLELRGTDASGYAAVVPGETMVVEKYPGRHTTNAHLFRWDVLCSAKASILHTRAATKGDPKQNENNHPLVSREIAVVHNGMIWNDDDAIEKIGWTRRARVDSEAILAPFAIHKNAVNSSRWISKNISGTYAYAALSESFGLAFLRESKSQLAWGMTEDILYFASTPAILSPVAKEVHTCPANLLTVICRDQITTHKIPVPSIKRGWERTLWQSVWTPPPPPEQVSSKAKSLETRSVECQFCGAVNDWPFRFHKGFLICRSCGRPLKVKGGTRP